jgi:hypothetical protein
VVTDGIDKALARAKKTAASAAAISAARTVNYCQQANALIEAPQMDDL